MIMRTMVILDIYIYQLNGSILNALYKKASSKQEIKRIEFPVEYKGKNRLYRIYRFR